MKRDRNQWRKKQKQKTQQKRAFYTKITYFSIHILRKKWKY